MGQTTTASYTVAHEGGSGDVEVVTSGTEYAEITQNGTSFTIKGKAKGTASITVIYKYKDAGNVDQSVEQTIAITVGDALVPTIKVGKDTLNMNSTLTTKVDVTITNPIDGAKLVAESSNTGVATASIDGSKVVIKGIAAGSAEITVKYQYKDVQNKDAEVSQKIKVTITTHPSQDTSTPLVTTSNVQVYVLDNGTYRKAVYADYYKDGMKFYTQTAAQYYGWQTINGSLKFFDKNGKYVTGEQVIQGAKYTFASDGSMVTGSGTMGIDVSKWNGNIDWKAVKNSGVSYVIIRCGYRGSSAGSLIQDSKYKQNIEGAIDAGLKVGVYFFTQAIDKAEAMEEASMVLDLVKKYKISYPIFLDVEASGGRADKLSKAERTEICKTFCETIQKYGYTAGIYANKTWLTNKMDASALSKYKIWLAQYAEKPTYTGTYHMWQYKDTGKVSGISGNVDLNISYLGY